MTSSWSTDTQYLCYLCVIHSSPTSAAYMSEWPGSAFPEPMLTCRLVGAKTLSEPMLTCPQLDNNRIFSFRKMRFKLSSAKWRPVCLDLNVLTLFLHFVFISTLRNPFVSSPRFTQLFVTPIPDLPSDLSGDHHVLFQASGLCLHNNGGGRPFTGGYRHCWRRMNLC